MRFKVEKEKRYNEISGKNKAMQRVFKKVDEGLSQGTLETITIKKDKIIIRVSQEEEKDEEKQQL